LISAGVVFVSLLFAFGRRIRAVLWALYHEASTAFFIHVGIYTQTAEWRPADEITGAAYKRAKHKKGKRRLEDISRKNKHNRAKKAQRDERRDRKRGQNWGWMGAPVTHLASLGWVHLRRGPRVPFWDDITGLLPKVSRPSPGAMEEGRANQDKNHKL
jgi:hypothetical protein